MSRWLSIRSGVQIEVAFQKGFYGINILKRVVTIRLRDCFFRFFLMSDLFGIFFGVGVAA